MKNISRYLTASILSISLLTVMAGAAIAPALGVIKAHFAGVPNLLIQFIISIPALFIVFTNLAFPYFCKLFKTRTLALLGLLIYTICGTIPFFANNIYIILIFRAMLGVSVGMIMKTFRMQMKYFAPCGFILGYLIFILSGELLALLAGSAIIGIANGIGIPYLNTIASIKGGTDAVTTVMPLISASLYLGQFLSPIYISELGNKLFSNVLAAPYYIAVIVGIIYLVQVYTTRHFQALHPSAEK